MSNININLNKMLLAEDLETIRWNGFVDEARAAVQAHIDRTAKSRGYNDGVHLAVHSTSTVPTWAAEAQAFIAWRDATWIYAYGLLENPPEIDENSIETLINTLPKIEWPKG